MLCRCLTFDKACLDCSLSFLGICIVLKFISIKCVSHVRHFIFDVFLNRMSEQSSQFVEELMPCLVNMRQGCIGCIESLLYSSGFCFKWKVVTMIALGISRISSGSW